MSLADSLALQTHLANAMADSASLLNQAHVQYQSVTGGSTVEKPAETQTNIPQLPISLERLTPDLEDMC